MTRHATNPALRAKTLALMLNPPKPPVEKMRGHRGWMVPLAERSRK